MEKFSIINGIEITVIGISIVFAGLILTYFMINLFSLIPRFIIFLKNRRGHEPAVNRNSHSGMINREHIAVIVTVLDIEMKMKNLLDKGRFTFK